MTRELDTKPSEKAINTVNNLNLVMHLIGNLNFATIFAFFMHEAWRQLLELKARWFLYILAAVIDIGYAIMEWTKMILQPTNSSIIRATVYTFVAIAISTAVAGLFAAHALFAVAAPYMFGIALGGKAAYHLISAGDNFRRFFDKKLSLQDRGKHLAGGIKDTVTGVFGAVATVGVVGVFILAKFIWFPAGMAGGILGALGCVAFGAHAMYKRWKEGKSIIPNREEVKQLLTDEFQPTPGAELQVQQGVANSNTVVKKSFWQEVGNFLFGNGTSATPPTKPVSTSTRKLQPAFRTRLTPSDSFTKDSQEINAKRTTSLSEMPEFNRQASNSKLSSSPISLLRPQNTQAQQEDLPLATNKKLPGRKFGSTGS